MLMARRFSRIKQASYLNQAVDNYINYLQTAATRPRNVGGGQPRPPQIALAIEPFTVATAADENYLAYASQPARSQMSSSIGTSAIEVGGAVNAKKVAGWSPARITMFVGTGTSAVATSAITGLRYLKYNGSSYSHPFGKAAATDSEYDKFLAIRAVLAGNNRRFSLKSEAHRQV